MLTDAKRAELHANYKAFVEFLPELLAEHEGQFALMRHREIVGFFATPGKALVQGRDSYDDELFSVQHVRKSIADFGWFSRASDHPTV